MMSNGSMGSWLLVAQGVDRIEAGCFARRVEAEEDADDSSDSECQEDRGGADLDRPSGDFREARGESDSESYPDQAAEDREGDGLEEELQQDVAALRSDGHADPDLTRPFGDRDEHD